MATVHNKYHKTAKSDAIYIGRGSPFGNPFKIDATNTRDVVCDKFENHLMNNPALIMKIKRELKGKDLVCFCKPARCHGDTLLRIANE